MAAVVQINIPHGLSETSLSQNSISGTNAYNSASNYPAQPQGPAQNPNNPPHVQVFAPNPGQAPIANQPRCSDYKIFFGSLGIVVTELAIGALSYYTIKDYNSEEVSQASGKIFSLLGSSFIMMSLNSMFNIQILENNAQNFENSLSRKALVILSTSTLAVGIYNIAKSFPIPGSVVATLGALGTLNRYASNASVIKTYDALQSKMSYCYRKCFG